MTRDEFSVFANAWADAHELMAGGKCLTEGAMNLCISALEKYPLNALLAAILRHVQTAKFAPTPADIIALLDVKSKRLTADEAWARVPKDETETVVWTDEMAKAYEIAYALLVDGDKIAARMAFKAAYERICTEVSISGQPVVWRVSLGSDKAKIAPVIEQAVTSGLLSRVTANQYLPTPMDGGPIGKLLMGKVVDLPVDNAELNKRWGKLKQALVDGNARLQAREEWQRDCALREKDEFERKRQQLLELVAQRNLSAIKADFCSA